MPVAIDPRKQYSSTKQIGDDIYVVIDVNNIDVTVTSNQEFKYFQDLRVRGGEERFAEPPQTAREVQYDISDSGDGSKINLLMDELARLNNGEIDLSLGRRQCIELFIEKTTTPNSQ